MARGVPALRIMATAANGTGRGRLRWIFAPWFLPVWYAAIAYSWWRMFLLEAARSDLTARPLVPASLELAATLAVAGKFSGFLAEAGFFHLFWRSRGHRLPLWRFFCVVASASMADLLASALVELPHGHSGSPPGWLWPLVGLQLLKGTAFHDAGALRAAFGTVGLLTGIRILITAHAQARALDRSWGRALTLTAGVWLATRIAVLWAVDLVKGMSPLGAER